MNHKTTEADFQKFVAYAKEYLDLLGIKERAIAFYLDDLEGPLAECQFPADDSHYLNFGFSIDWGDMPVTDSMIRKVAYHEVLHGAMADILTFALDQSYSHDQRKALLDRAMHAFIRRLENAYVPAECVFRATGEGDNKGWA